MPANFVNPLPGVPFVESPFFDHLLVREEIGEEYHRIAVSLRDKGYAVFRFPDDEIDAVAERIKTQLQTRFDWAAWRSGRVSGMRVQDAWQWNEDVKRLAVNERVLDLLSALYGRRAFPFQTLNFPVGTQQHYHTDSVHFSSLPERFMCGVWIALEDIGPDQGPLVYYPGSHTWPIYFNEQIGVANGDERIHQHFYDPVWERLVELKGATPERLIVKRGEALIWAANLLHGGDAHHDRSQTRWSQVNHYYFDDCSYITPFHCDLAEGSIAFREPFDITTGQRVPKRASLVEGPPGGRGLGRSNLTVRQRVLRIAPDFNDAAYLAANPDVAAAGVDAAEHYWDYGRREGRRIR